MNEEELLRGVADHARGEEADPKLAVLDRLARGEAVRESELAGIDEETLALFRPLDRAAETRIADRLTGPKSRASRSGGNVRRVRFGRYIPLFAVAAAVLLFFVWPGRREILPRYAFELSGNVAELRANGPEVVEAHAKLQKDANLEIVLRPEAKVTTKIGVRAALVRDGKARAWSPPVAISDDGAVRIAGPAKKLFPDVDAPWEILVAVGPEHALPIDPQALLGNPEGYRVVRGFVEFVP